MTHGTLPPIWSQDEIAKAEAQDADHFARQMRRARLADGVRMMRRVTWCVGIICAALMIAGVVMLTGAEIGGFWDVF